ncbi:MAG: ATP-binding protein [Armatimonadota bacterium]|nr:ATP-binding protein [Armatimonadota bacterium]MDW8156566.1 ATP-binding protein [Armatimonadota bacterium]
MSPSREPPTPPVRRTFGLRAQLALAFAAVALLAVVAVGLWAQHLTAVRFQAYMERVRRGQVPWLAEQPAHVRELWLQSLQPKVWLFRASQRKFLGAFNQSLWLGGGTAAAVAVLAGLWLAGRLTRPLAELQAAARAIASGRLDHRVRARGGEMGEVAEAFNAMAARLEADERLRREFLAAVAHELRTPLANVQAHLEAFLDGVAEPTPERIAALHTQTVLLSRLVNDLRDLTLAQAGALPLHRSRVDLEEVCREVVEALQPWFEERGLSAEVQAEGAVHAWGDPQRVRQVVQNLVHNAVRFSPAGGRVRLQLALRGGWAELAVEDEGPGISPEDLERVFEPFYRAEPSRSRQAGGSGLGLAVVKHLVLAHGGSVRAERRPEGGSRFVVQFPTPPAGS